jgi:hypothetical protein
MTFENFNHLAGGIESMATVAALIVGGYWTYTRFIKQRENFAFIEFTVDINFIGKQSGWRIVELIAYLENKGKVQHEFQDLSFELEALFANDPVGTSEQFGGQEFFPHPLARGPWVPKGEYFIEPSIRAKYSYVARVPEKASFLILHGKFTYLNQSAWHTAERTVQVPSVTAGTQNLEAQQ